MIAEKRLLRIAAEKSCWEKLLRKAAEKRCWFKLLRRDAGSSCWEEMLRRAAEKGCWEELLRKAAEKSCWEKLLRRAAEKSCWEELLRKAAEKSCWEERLRRDAEQSCWERLLLLKRCSSLKFLLFFAQGRFGRSRRETTLSSLRARRTPKTVVKCKFSRLPKQPSRHFVPKTVVKCKFSRLPKQPSRHFVLVGRSKLWWNANFLDRQSNPLVISCSSDARNCGEMQICGVLAQPFRHFVLVGRPKLWWNATFLRGPSNPFVTSCLSDVRNCGKMMIFVCREAPWTSLTCFIHFCARHCSKTYIWKFLMARRCSETHILILPDEPSRRIRWVDRAKLWRNANFGGLKLLRALSWACERLCVVSAR